MPSSRITLQHLTPEVGYWPLPQCDARIAGTGLSPPPSILLDFMYGVAAFRCWGAGQDINEEMGNWFTKHYQSIPIPPPGEVSSDDDNIQDSDDLNDGDYEPDGQRRRRNHRSQDEMLRAMDYVLALSMFAKGTTPQLMAAERQRQEQEAELRAKEASRVKVRQWKETSLCALSCLHSNSHQQAEL